MDGTDAGRYTWQEAFEELAVALRRRPGQQEQGTREETREDRERRYMVRVARDERAPILVMMPPGYGKTRTILIQARTALRAGVIPIIVVAEPYVPTVR